MICSICGKDVGYVDSPYSQHMLGHREEHLLVIDIAKKLEHSSLHKDSPNKYCLTCRAKELVELKHDRSKSTEDLV